MDHNRFTIGLTLFLAGLVWNIYYSVLTFRQPFDSPYDLFLYAGGVIITVGLLTMVLAFPSRGQRR
jgi:hypothetical protein